MEIITNRHWNNFLYGYELPESVRSDFDYMDDIDCGTFFKYRGTYYDLGEFMRIEQEGDVCTLHDDFLGWHGYHGDSFFSGILVRVSDDGEQYQVATYIS